MQCTKQDLPFCKNMFTDLAWLEFFLATTSFLVHSFNLFVILRCLQSATVLPCSFLEPNDCLDALLITNACLEKMQVVYCFMSSLNLLIVTRFVYKRRSGVIVNMNCSTDNGMLTTVMLTNVNE